MNSPLFFCSGTTHVPALESNLYACVKKQDPFLSIENFCQIFIESKCLIALPTFSYSPTTATRDIIVEDDERGEVKTQDLLLQASPTRLMGNLQQQALWECYSNKASRSIFCKIIRVFPQDLWEHLSQQGFLATAQTIFDGTLVVYAFYYNSVDGMAHFMYICSCQRPTITEIDMIINTWH